MMIFFLTMIFCASGLFAAAPLENGYSHAPIASASTREKAQAFLEARYKVINAAEKYEKTPYRYGGIDRKGLDCSGLIYISFKDALGVSLPRSSAGLYSWTEKIPSDKVQPGDLLFFKTNNTDKISHVALYIGGGSFIHAASAGPQTGVIYSNLSERYWSRTFAGAGRAFPEVDENSVSVPVRGGTSAETNTAVVGGAVGGWDRPGYVRPDTSSGENQSRLLLGAAIAPTWSGFLKGSELVRGVASQLHLGAETYTFGSRMVFGLQVRPEYDGALGVFRLPITFSWGPSEKFMIFAGPVFSFGDA
ncbi:MAG: C40 family peptidase, partial [Treponema sp.]|nr:C40 family peptidase [Treponema sp.]